MPSILMQPNIQHHPCIAVVGCGNWGQNLVRNFASLNSLAAICDASPAVLEAAKKLAPLARAVSQLNEVLTDPSINAVVLATPAETHVSLALAVLASGKDVFVEKPMTLNVVDAAKLVEEADRLDRILMVGHILLYSPSILRVKQLIDDGELGRIQHVAVKRAKQGKVRANENVMWSFACHDIAAVLFLLGQELPATVQAIGRSFIQPNIEDDTHLHLGFDTGASAHIHSSWYWPDNERHYTVLGDRQWLKLDEVAGSITIHRKGITPQLQNRDEGFYTIKTDDELPLLRECRHFLQCIATRQRPLSDDRNGLAVVRVLEQASISMHTGKMLML